MQFLTPLDYPSGTDVHIHCTTPVLNPNQYVSQDESDRARRIIDPIKRDRFLAGRGYVRTTLSRYLQIPEHEIQLGIGEYGKPFLIEHPHNVGLLHFNHSHSGPLLLLAVATYPALGIDIEQINPNAPIVDMARLAFSQNEQSELFHYPEDQQIAAFYRCWTRKEAFLKSCGKGFSMLSNSFNVSLLSEVVVEMETPNTNEKWYIQEVKVPEGFYASCATTALSAELHYIL